MLWVKLRRNCLLKPRLLQKNDNMKVKDLKQLRDKTIKELEDLVKTKRQELLLFYAKIKAGKEKNTSLVKKIRRDIAQILTLVKEKEILEKNKKL